MGKTRKPDKVEPPRGGRTRLLAFEPRMLLDGVGLIDVPDISGAAPDSDIAARIAESSPVIADRNITALFASESSTQSFDKSMGSIPGAAGPHAAASKGAVQAPSPLAADASAGSADKLSGDGSGGPEKWQPVIIEPTGVHRGSDSDIAGDASFATAFRGGSSDAAISDMVFFRMHTDARAGGLDGVATIGVDGDRDGRVDLFAAADTGAQLVRLLDLGSGVNLSPTTTTMPGALAEWRASDRDFQANGGNDLVVAIASVNDSNWGDSVALTGDGKPDSIVSSGFSVSNITRVVTE